MCVLILLHMQMTVLIDFPGELVKFKLFPKTEALHCLKVCLNGVFYLILVHF